ncbi:undecaprenyl-phosphate glucose phosphotransferase [Glaciecola petra]|uniref:Undecaprenyl-phosphate glucose phosphotransferase n=1 Tax=Glaciecola petra TaxID=3075602 RepID=A0ABU2ZMB8_9ALTE|nr:undecaprenyl-phosphate glucose phosphotransferase [Aestuariibacter sp. P117]MDT0593775.1 undecaprenyl-phosphate glucose phosphotransferase [Aestuariibacter sp. P117]
MSVQFNKGYLHRYGALFIILIILFDLFFIIGSFKGVLYFLEIEETNDYLFTLALTLIIFLTFAMSLSFYRSFRTTPILSEIGELFLYWGSTFVSISTLVYLFEQKMPVSSDILVLWFSVSFVCLAISRFVLRTVAYSLRKVGHNFRRVAIVGHTEIGESLFKSIQSNKWMGLHFVGFFDARNTKRDARLDQSFSHEQFEVLLSKIARNEVDIVYITLPMSAQKRIQMFIDQLSQTNVAIYYAPDFYSFDLLRASWDSIDGQPLVSIIETPLLGDNNLIKRLMDIFISSAILLVIGLPLLLFAILIKMDSKGPIIYKQKRYGLDGKSFIIYKFRTMQSNPEDQVFKQAQKNDSRITKHGKWMRKYSVDELPQFINVLQGRMSIVGPRPHPLALDDEHQALIRRYNLRFKVKPGITGWAQVNGYRGETKTLECMNNRIRYDLEYINKWSVYFDIKIILLTFKSVIKPVNAF